MAGMIATTAAKGSGDQYDALVSRIAKRNYTIDGFSTNEDLLRSTAYLTYGCTQRCGQAGVACEVQTEEKRTRSFIGSIHMGGDGATNNSYGKGMVGHTQRSACV